MTRPDPRPADFLSSLFAAPPFLAFTIGIPFSVFKLLFGTLSLRAAPAPGSPLALLGWLVILWAGVDLVMNLARSLYYITGRNSPVEYCTIAQLGRHFRRPQVFLALDTLLSFSIICLVLWSGWIVNLRGYEPYLWYAATTLNLISVSVVGLWAEIHRTQQT